MSRTPPSPSIAPDHPGKPVPGVISRLEVYRLDEALLRLGWSLSAYRAARRRGLQVLASGKRRYLHGREIMRFLAAESGAAGSPQE
ncbi:MAG: hypothetical protein KF688_16555 [Pirellulales bacterium]|nr:hypothetical protein [Pirellulales bacterium]